jgi:glutamine synthetase
MPSSGKDEGAVALAAMNTYEDCVIAEYVWVDAHGHPRSKAKTVTSIPACPSDLGVWNYDGSSTEQADGHDSEVLLHPVAVFKDPFRGAPHVLVLAEAKTPSGQAVRGSTRSAAAAVLDNFASYEPWFGIEQEYTLMRPDKIGLMSKIPLGFHEDGSEPGPQGPYYCGVGSHYAVGRPIADEHYVSCLKAGVKIAGLNLEVMPGQLEFQVGPCKGMEAADHLLMARYLLLRVAEKHGAQVTFHPKPCEGDWNGAGLHTNFSLNVTREEGGYEKIVQICEAFGKKCAEHIAEYGEDNDKRLTGKHETCSIHEFKYGVANRGASIRIPRETEARGRGYLEDRRPASNADPYRVIARMMRTAGEALTGKSLDI